MTKSEAIKKIRELPSVYLNDDQKRISIGIIKSIPKGQDVLNYFDFIMKRADVGFKFDVAPEIAIGRIASINEMEKLRINVKNNVDSCENKLIIGDNYEGLKNLLLTHKGKVDFIYIDPPYNIEKSKDDGNSSSKEECKSRFMYKDKFGRNGWLNMLRDRLILAKRLLSKEGIIFVSIDDSEQAYLKVLMDGIFGEDNFLNQLVWVSNKKGRQISNSPFIKTYEYILVYSKSQGNDFKSTGIERKWAESEMSAMYSKNDVEIEEDAFGKFICQNELHNTNIKEFNKTTRKNLFYPIYTDGSCISLSEKSGFVKILPPKNRKGVQGVWRWGKGKVEKEPHNLKIVAKNKTFKIFTKKRDLDYAPKDVIICSKMTTKSGSTELETLGIGEFDYPKPSSLIEFLLKTISKKDSIVLDFFAGSGTTAHAVLKMNMEDEGNRRFILITNNENSIGVNVTYERLHGIIIGKSTRGSTLDWVNDNEPFKNTKLRVFNIKHFDVETDQCEKLNDISKFAVKNLKKLEPDYKPDDIQVYYDLDGLNPLNEAQRNQVYSTDPLIHMDSKSIRTINNKTKFFCSCGKSFKSLKNFNEHKKRENK